MTIPSTPLTDAAWRTRKWLDQENAHEIELEKLKAERKRSKP